MSSMNVSMPVLTMHWLAAVSTLLIAIGSGCQAVSAILAFRVELRESGIQALFDAYINPVREAADLKPHALKLSLKLFNPFYVAGLWLQVARNTRKLLRIPNDNTVANKRRQNATAAVATATLPTMVGQIAAATMEPSAAKDELLTQITAEAQKDRTAKAAQVRQLLFTGVVWTLIMYGSLFALCAVGIQLYLDYTS
jgi:hypothetical protein